MAEQGVDRLSTQITFPGELHSSLKRRLPRDLSVQMYNCAAILFPENHIQVIPHFDSILSSYWKFIITSSMITKTK